MSDDNQPFIRKGNLITIDQYAKGVSPEVIEQRDYVANMLSTDPNKKPLKLEDQIAYFKLEKTNGKDGKEILTYGGGKLYEGGKELKAASKEYEQAKKDLGQKYGDKAYPRAVADKVFAITSKAEERMGRMATAEVAKAGLASVKFDETGQAKLGGGYEKTIEAFKDSTAKLKGIENILKDEKSYLYTTQVTFDGNAKTKPDIQDVNKGIANVLRDQSLLTGVDASTKEGFDKLQDVKSKSLHGKILIEYKNSATGEITNLKLKGEDFTKVLKNVTQESLMQEGINKKGEKLPYDKLEDREDQKKVIANVSKELDGLKGKVDISAGSKDITVSIPLKVNLEKAFDRVSEVVSKKQQHQEQQFVPRSTSAPASPKAEKVETLTRAASDPVPDNAKYQAAAKPTGQSKDSLIGEARAPQPRSRATKGAPPSKVSSTPSTPLSNRSNPDSARAAKQERSNSLPTIKSDITTRPRRAGPAPRPIGIQSSPKPNRQVRSNSAPNLQSRPPVTPTRPRRAEAAPKPVAILQNSRGVSVKRDSNSPPAINKSAAIIKDPQDNKALQEAQNVFKKNETTQKPVLGGVHPSSSVGTAPAPTQGRPRR